jgi:hypothetical protein
MGVWPGQCSLVTEFTVFNLIEVIVDVVDVVTVEVMMDVGFLFVDLVEQTIVVVFAPKQMWARSSQTRWIDNMAKRSAIVRDPKVGVTNCVI